MLDLPGDLALSHQTVLETVVRHLRGLILTRRLKPGDRLVQGELAEQFGVSRTPIREALQQLASEGLVTISPYKGASVVALAPEELEEIYHVRIGLEGYAARLVARHITAEEIEQLRAVLDNMQEAFSQQQPEELLEINRKFYVTLYKATRQQRLYDMIVNHLDLSQQYRRLYFYLEHLAANTVTEHEKIIRIVEQGDEDGAEEIIRAGLERTLAGLMQSLQTPVPES